MFRLQGASQLSESSPTSASREALQKRSGKDRDIKVRWGELLRKVGGDEAADAGEGGARALRQDDAADDVSDRESPPLRPVDSHCPASDGPLVPWSALCEPIEPVSTMRPILSSCGARWTAPSREHGVHDAPRVLGCRRWRVAEIGVAQDRRSARSRQSLRRMKACNQFRVRRATCSPITPRNSPLRKSPGPRNLPSRQRPPRFSTSGGTFRLFSATWVWLKTGDV
jgi:hypothetical protein